MSRHKLYLTITFFFYFLFYQNFFKVTDNETFKSLRWWSDDLVWQKLERVRSHGINWEGGFLIYNYHTRNRPSPFSLYQEQITGEVPYFSQYGLQGRIFGQVYQYLNGTLSENIIYFQVLITILLALIWTCFFRTILKIFGFPSFALTSFFLIGSRTIFSVSHSLYWLMFLQLIPFVTSWIIYPLTRNSKKNKYLFATILYLFFLTKMLCGYEFLTCTILSCMVPILYFDQLKNKPIKSTTIKFIKLGIIGTTSFFSAIAIHLIQIKDLVGSYSLAIEILSSRASLHATLKENINIIEYILYTLKELLKYTIFVVPLPVSSKIFTIPLAFPILILLAGTIYLIFQQKTSRVIPSETEQKIKALTTATWFSLFASSSWWLIAKGHILEHLSEGIQVTPLIFYIPFLPMAYCWIGFVIKNWLPIYQKRNI